MVHFKQQVETLEGTWTTSFILDNTSLIASRLVYNRLYKILAPAKEVPELCRKVKMLSSIDDELFIDLAKINIIS